jgi:hypothetical protein
VISGIYRDVDEICCLLVYNTALSGSFASTFRENLLVPSSRDKKPKKTLEDGSDRLSRNVGTEVPLNAA